MNKKICILEINQEHFNLDHTFECGQCFRWKKNLTKKGLYIGVVQDEVLEVFFKKNKLIIIGSNDKEKWEKYFDVKRNYEEIKKILKTDKIMEKCINKGYGIRILKQNTWETIISFIISANNNIPRIRKIISKFCMCFGKKIGNDENGENYYSFPSIETVSNLEIEDLAPIKAGFRDKYIIQTAKKIMDLEYDFETLETLPTKKIFKKLIKLNGVGEKISECVLLFSFARHEVFPKDTWINKILKFEYGVETKGAREFLDKKFGNFAGFAQQYLYFYFKNDLVFKKKTKL